MGHHRVTLYAVVVGGLFVVPVKEGRVLKIIVVRPTKFWGKILKSLFKV